jgi:hypothetical protein
MTKLMSYCYHYLNYQKNIRFVVLRRYLWVAMMYYLVRRLVAVLSCFESSLFVAKVQLMELLLVVI